MRRLGPLLALLWVALAAGAAPAAAEVAEGIALVAGKQVPLPPGRWERLADTRDGAAEAALETQVLARIEDGAVAGLVVVVATAAPRTSILGASSQCGRSDVYLAWTAYDSAYDGLCGYLDLVLLSPEVGGPPAWVAARRLIEARRLRMGATWLVSGLRARTRTAAVEVRYYFPPPGPPEADATSWAESPWAPARIDAEPARAAAVARLAIWSAWARDLVADGLVGQLTSARPLPWPWGSGDLAAALVASRLETLDALAAAGAVSGPDYRAQRQALEQLQVTPERAETPVWLHVLWKTLSYRVAAFLDAVGVSYLVLGDPYFSGAFATIGAVIRPAAVYLHDLAWTYSGYGSAAPALRSADFAEIGLDR